MERAEKSVRELFTDIGAEITYVKKKVEEFTAENAAPQPIPQSEPVKSDIVADKKGGNEQKSDAGAAPLQDTEFEKKCPMCGGRMNFHIGDDIWQCYSCAYEESSKV
jgi:hypothetical protein